MIPRLGFSQSHWPKRFGRNLRFARKFTQEMGAVAAGGNVLAFRLTVLLAAILLAGMGILAGDGLMTRASAASSTSAAASTSVPLPAARPDSKDAKSKDAKAKDTKSNG